MEPSTHTATAPLTQALALTHAMLSAAKEADWPKLLQLEQARESLIRRQHPTDVVSRARIEQILAYDRQLLALLGTAREAVARQWQAQRSRSQAIAAYAQS